MQKKLEPELVIIQEREETIFTFADVAKVLRRYPEMVGGHSSKQEGFYFILYTPNGETHEAKALSLQAALTNVKNMIPDSIFEQGFIKE